MGSKTLKENLGLLDFEDSSASGLLFTDREYKDDPNVSFDERLILRRAKELDAMAVYFRRFENRCRSSVPQLFIYDNSSGQFEENDPVDIHRKLSSSGIVPIYYVFDNVEVKIYDCRKSLQRKGNALKSTPFDTLKLISEAHKELKKYSAHLFRNGSFWEREENKDRFKVSASSHKKLIDNLKHLRDDFVKKQENVAACNKLIVLSILVKYLEQRKDSSGNAALPKNYFDKFHGATSFCDVLRKRKAIELFEDLGTNINGSIFKLNPNEKSDIRKLDQSWLAKFLDADIELDKQQYVLWKLYDFNYLPVELISRIYEEFITQKDGKKRKDIAYTPPCLVDFMIDECMPIDKPQKNFKVIDVSCGSGIFLVGAFKRIVQWRQYSQYQETREIKPPQLRTLKPLLRDLIFGVDIEPEAVRLAIFSLTIAVCDMLDPMTLWKELNEEKLEDLSNNIISSDFFDFLPENKRKYDLVIGNPPFNPLEENGYWDKTIQKIELDFDIRRNNIALLFLQQAMKIVKEKGLLSFVLPSGPLLYNNTLEYRRMFLSKYNVPQVFDFSRLKLFDNGSSVSVLFAEKSVPDEKDILHVVVQRTKTSKDKLFFEIDKYDLHYVTKMIAKTERLVWKTNYLGGGHLFHLLKRIESIKSLEFYLKKKKKSSGWFFAEGYKPVGEATKEPKKAKYLTGQRMIPTRKFICDEINDLDIETETEQLFDRPRKDDKLIFKAPHLLIKERPSLPIAFRDDDLIFRREIVGVHAPDKAELMKLRKNIISNKALYKMLLLSGSGRAGVSRSIYTINKKDIMALPYSEDSEKLKLSKAEQVICDDVLNYYIEQMSKGEEAKINVEEATKKDLTSYGKTFCTALNSIYGEDSKEFYPLEPIRSLSYICTPFAYGNPNEPEEISDEERGQIEAGDLSSLMENDQDGAIYYKRIIKHYRQDKNMVFLIKPKFLRYWLRSIALRDANEVFTDLVSSGY